MIVLKASPNKVVACTPPQSFLDVIERHMKPILDKVIIHKTISSPTTAKPIARNAHPVAWAKAALNRALSAVPRTIGFFSATKANLRNAP